MRTNIAALAALAMCAALTSSCGGSAGGNGTPTQPPPDTGTTPPPGGGVFPSSADVTATIGNFFAPQSADIAKNGAVNFIFQSTLHNVTFTPATGVPADIGNTSGATVSATFNRAGTFAYQCTLHPGMAGVVVVH